MIDFLSKFAYHSEDPEEIRREKITAVIVSGSTVIAGAIWGILYYFVFGWGITTMLPVVFVMIVGAAMIVSHFTRNYRIAIWTQILCILFITALIQWSIGGVFDSGLVLIWAFIAPLTALLFTSLRKSILIMVFFVIIVGITVGFDEFFASRGMQVSETTRNLFFLMNLAVSSVIVFTFSGYFVLQTLRERQRANDVLLNTLPKSIISLLKSGQDNIADHYEEVSVMFIDIVSSTKIFSDLEPADVVDWLNEIFTVMDQCVENYDVEKIRTIGDGYMIASGVPAPNKNHARDLCYLGLGIIKKIHDIPERHGIKIQVRIGINSGPLVAGVIGKTKYQFDIWGDTVNVASRMESHGEAGKIHVTKETRDLVSADFNCVSRGIIKVKNKGSMETYFIEPLNN